MLDIDHRKAALLYHGAIRDAEHSVDDDILIDIQVLAVAQDGCRRRGTAAVVGVLPHDVREMQLLHAGDASAELRAVEQYAGEAHVTCVGMRVHARHGKPQQADDV